jgi:hypothetical protein
MDPLSERDAAWKLSLLLEDLIEKSKHRELDGFEKGQMHYAEYYLENYERKKRQAIRNMRTQSVAARPGPGIASIAASMHGSTANRSSPPGFPAYWEPAPLRYENNGPAGAAATATARKSTRKTRGKKRGRSSSQSR